MMGWAARQGDAACTRIAGAICHAAAYWKRRHVLDWMLAAGHLARDSSAPAVEATDGSTDSLETLQWLYEHGVLFDASVFEQAAAVFDMEVMTWLRDIVRCPWDSRACVAAAKHVEDSPLEALQWLVEAGCPLSRHVWDAAESLETRKWLCKLPSRPWDDKLVLWALRKGNKSAAKWALANERNAAEAVRTCGCAAAIASEDLAIVTWARTHGGKWSDACAQALESASDEMVACCETHGCPVGEV
jgi:hypothetical protein